MKNNLLLATILFLLHFNFINAQKTNVLETPHSSVYNHLFYLQIDSYEPSLSARSISDIINLETEEKAIKIKQILDAKGLFVVMSKIPGYNPSDSISGNSYVLFPKEMPEIYLEKRNGNWYYSKETVELIPKLHKQLYPLGSDMLLNVFPKFGTGEFLGIKVWQYLGMLIFLGLAFLFYLIISKIIDIIISSIAKTKLGQEYADNKTVHKIAKLIGLFLVMNLLDLFLPVLQLPIHLSRVAYLVLDILKYCFIILMALNILELIMVYAKSWAEKTESKMDDQLLIILRKFLQIGIVVFGLISILNRLDVNVTALLAGVSIGGLAIALAAQDSVKNLIGALMIFIDRPFDVGDYIISGSIQGVVQEVGFRSTRLLASDTSSISVPNGKMANDVINNLGRRVYRRYRTQIGIKYDTPPESIDLFVRGTEEILRLHPHTLDEKTEVHLNNFSPTALEIFVQTFFTVDGWSEELRSKHNLMLEIISLANILNIEFALPANTLHIDESNMNTEIAQNKTTEELKKSMDGFLKKYKGKLEG